VTGTSATTCPRLSSRPSCRNGRRTTR
jgi:hypothetical protein